MELNAWGIVIVLGGIGFSLWWAWNKIKGQQSQIYYLDKWLQDIGHKVEHLEKELLKKKIIDTYYKSKKDLEREKLDKEFDEELEDRLKKNEKEQENLLRKMDEILESEDKKNNK